MDQVTGAHVVAQVAGASSGNSSGSVGSSSRSSCGGSSGRSSGGGSSSRSSSGGSSGRCSGLHVDRVAGAVQMAVVILMSFRQTIGLVCDISNLSDNHNFELMLNNFTPGNGYEFTHRGHAEGGEEMEVVFSTGVANPP